MIPLAGRISTATALSPVIPAILLLTFPGAEFASTLAALCLIIAVAVGLLRFSSLGNCETAYYAVIAAFILIASGIIVNVYGFTTASGATTSDPVLLNPDQRRYFEDALFTLDPSLGAAASPKHHGYGLLIAGIWSITGITIVSPLMLNLFATLITIIATGILTLGITRDRRTAAVAMVSLTAVCYFLNSSTLLLRESLCALGFALFAISLFSLRKGFRIPILLAGIAIIALLRPLWLLAFVPVTILSPRSFKARIAISCGIGVITAVLFFSLFPTGQYTTGFDTLQQANLTDSDSGTRGLFWNILGKNYFSLSLIAKTALLPFTAATQFLTPFPWNFSRDMIYGLTQFYSHISYPWYIVGGCFIYGLGRLREKAVTASLARLSVAAVILWLGIALIMAGSVSRYTLPLMPLIVPLSATVIVRFLKDRSFIIYASSFCVILTVTLIVLYNLTTA